MTAHTQLVPVSRTLCLLTCCLLWTVLLSSCTGPGVGSHGRQETTGYAFTNGRWFDGEGFREGTWYAAQGS